MAIRFDPVKYAPIPNAGALSSHIGAPAEQTDRVRNLSAMAEKPVLIAYLSRLCDATAEGCTEDELRRIILAVPDRLRGDMLDQMDSCTRSAAEYVAANEVDPGRAPQFALHAPHRLTAAVRTYLKEALTLTPASAAYAVPYLDHLSEEMRTSIRVGTLDIGDLTGFVRRAEIPIQKWERDIPVRHLKNAQRMVVENTKPFSVRPMARVWHDTKQGDDIPPMTFGDLVLHLMGPVPAGAETVRFNLIGAILVARITAATAVKPGKVYSQTVEEGLRFWAPGNSPYALVENMSKSGELFPLISYISGVYNSVYPGPSRTTGAFTAEDIEAGLGALALMAKEHPIATEKFAGICFGARKNTCNLETDQPLEDTRRHPSTIKADDIPRQIDLLNSPEFHEMTLARHKEGVVLFREETRTGQEEPKRLQPQGTKLTEDRTFVPRGSWKPRTKENWKPTSNRSKW